MNACTGFIFLEDNWMSNVFKYVRRENELLYVEINLLFFFFFQVKMKFSSVVTLTFVCVVGLLMFEGSCYI